MHLHELRKAQGGRVSCLMRAFAGQNQEHQAKPLSMPLPYSRTEPRLAEAVRYVKDPKKRLAIVHNICKVCSHLGLVHLRRVADDSSRVIRAYAFANLIKQTTKATVLTRTDGQCSDRNITDAVMCSQTSAKRV